MILNWKKFGQNLIDHAVRAAFSIGALLDDNMGKYMLKSCLKSFEASADSYVSFVRRPKAVERIADILLESTVKEKIAVILQGPVMEKDNFTLETVKLYKRMMPEAIIVLSTWSDTDPKIMEGFRKLDIEIVQSSYPKHTGVGNVNYQVWSTKQGIRRAKECGAVYVAKTRTDQRFSQTNLLEYLYALIKNFPVPDRRYAKCQKERIVALQGSVGGNMFIPYFVPDFFLFGNVDDIWNFFDMELQEVDQTRRERSQAIGMLRKKSIWEYYYHTAPEVQMTMHYLERAGIGDLPVTCGKWWDIVRNLFVFVSYEDVKFFWPKYDNHFDENFVNMSYADHDPLQRKTYVWNFHNWFLVQTGVIVYTAACDDYIKEEASVI